MKIFAALFVIILTACSERAPVIPADWDAWAVWVEARYPVSDADGHGPDIGSDEWSHALQQKLGIVDDQGHGPDIGSAEWREAVQAKIVQ